MNREEVKKLSKKLNLPVADIRKELKDYSDFCSTGVDICHRKREEDPEVTEALMNECVRRSEASQVPLIKEQYLADASCYAAMYIERNYDSNKPLPDFYGKALEQIESSLLKNCRFGYVLVWGILSLAGMSDTESILDLMKAIDKANSPKFQRWCNSDQRYDRYERMCFKIAYSKYFNSETSWAEKIKLFEYLTRLKNKQLRMTVYGILYALRTDLNNIQLTDNRKFAPSEFNPETGCLLFEEYLVNAYSVLDYSLDKLDINSFYDCVWLAIAVQYAKWMYYGDLPLIPHKPKKALKILRYAAQTDNSYVSNSAKAVLRSLGKEE